MVKHWHSNKIKIMRFFIYFLLIFFTSISTAQIKNGTVKYNVVFDAKVAEMKENDIYKQALTATDRLNCTLNFNNEESIFFLEAGIDDDLAYSYAKIIAGVHNEIYQNRKDSIVVYNNSENSRIMKEAEFLIREKIKTDWVLHNETKKIDNYLCLKATTTRTVTNQKGTFIFPVVAWYCPQIPFGYGPKGYGNLPGLILELQERNVVFGAVSISFNIPSLQITALSKGKIVDEKEYNSIVKERSEENRKRMQRELQN